MRCDPILYNDTYPSWNEKRKISSLFSRLRHWRNYTQIYRFAITQFFQIVAWRTRSRVFRVRVGQRALDNSLDS